jgi:hypothetical protein
MVVQSHATFVLSSLAIAQDRRKMGDPFLIAVAALGLSFAVSGIRFIDWFIHSEPRAVVRTARCGGMALAILAVAVLLVLLINQQWTAAISLAAAMMLVVAWYGPRLFRAPFRLLDLAPEQDSASDPALVRRSAAVLEAYLRQQHAAERKREVQTANGHANGRVSGGSRGNGHDNDLGERDSGSGVMSEQDALDILGLEPGAQDVEINEAHRRLVQMLHPDRGGSHYLTVKINQAKATLLRDADRAIAAGPLRKASRRRAQPRRHS